MSSDLAITLGILALAALTLHLKSHVKFIALGSFIGLVLAETIGVPFHDYLASHFKFFAHADSTAGVQLTLLLLPTILLGLNHSGEKRHLGLGRTVVTVVSATLFLLANVLAYLPQEWHDELAQHSNLAQQLDVYRIWIIVLMAVVIVVDSFYHKKLLQSKKKKKK